MRSLTLLVLLSLFAGSMVQAQEAPVRTLRPPNLPNARGTDSGPGPACNQLTSYGQMQPAGPPATAYGSGAPAPGPAPTLPPMAAAAPARAESTLGAAGAGGRGIVVPDAPRLPYRFVEAPQPPRGTAGFANVNGVGVLKNGRLIVNQRLPMFQVLEYAPDGRLTRVIDPNLVSRPHGMRVDRDDNIWITDQQCNMVVKLNPAGEVLLTLGTPGKAGTWDEARGDHLFNQPTDIAFGPTGDVFVSTGHGGPDPRVVRFDRTGRFLTTWSLKHPDGSQAVIHTLVVNARGEVYVGDREVKVIRVFDVTGKPLRDIQMRNLVCGLYVDARNQLWMTTGQDGMVLRLDWAGKVLGWFGQEGFGPNDFGEAHYMAMTADGRTIYVGDTVNNDIKKLELIR